MIHVHMIDDDEDMHELLEEYFSDENIRFTASATPVEGLRFLDETEVDLILMDFMMPELDGFQTYQRLRERHPLMPVIMLTAKKDDYNKIVGLELGLDDYLAKPFNPRELLARIKTIMRRFERSQQFQTQQRVRYLEAKAHPLRINLDGREVFLREQKVDLTTGEFDLLVCLLESQGIVLSRDTLMNRLRGVDYDAFDRTIDVLISRLRQKLEHDPKKPQLIKTVRGVGYLLTR